MNEPASPPDPPRLTREDDEAARLLETVASRYRQGLDESGAWRRVEGARRRRSALSWAAAACVGLLGAAFMAGNAWKTPPESGMYALAPEPLPQAPAAPEAVVVPRASVTSAPVLAPPEPRARALPRVVASLTPGDVSAEVPPNEARCQQWRIEGKLERSIECFRALSRATGLDAEVALYEAARLSAEGLGDPEQALTLLDEHKQRFASGAMRGEVAWLRVRCLQRAGRLDDALRESEALLATPTGRTLASELHWLRGKLLHDQKQDCERAVPEYVALVGEPGARGDEAELRRARCLEKLGRSSDAVKAYEQYLERRDARGAAEARQRLSVLRD